MLPFKKGAIKMNSLNKTAKIVAILTLIIVFLAPFSMLYVPSTLIVAGDASTTSANIMANDSLFRMAMASDAIVFLLEIVLTVMIFALMKPVNETLSLVASYARLAMTVVQGINLLNYFFVLLLLSGASYLNVFEAEQLQAMTMLFLNLHDSVVLIWGAFFAVHLLVLGYLVYKSGYIPKLIGIFLVITAVIYFVQSFGTILLPQYKEAFSSMASLAFIEIVFPLWLLIKGVKVSE
jgi:hypothetical protein